MSTQLDQFTLAIADRYTLHRELGRGGMATVHLASDHRYDREVAIKILQPDLASAVGRERFLREIDIAARLTHPHILPLYDSGEVADLLYYVMPFVEGESLRQRLDREKVLPLEEALDITRTLATALTYAHEKGVVHRDVKPENILLSGEGAQIADFGVARALNLASSDRITVSGLTVGSPLYMSPEQASAKGKPDARSDIYSLACVLYEMLIGEPPFTGRTPLAVMARHATEPVPYLRIICDTIPIPVESAVRRALAKDPVDRFEAAEIFADALISGPEEPGPMDPGPSGSPQRTAEGTTRRPWQLWSRSWGRR